MKKIFALFIFILFVVFGYLYINRINNKNVDDDYYEFLSMVRDNDAILSNYYVYGNHLGLEGFLDVDDVNPDNFFLVLKSNDFEKEIDCFFEGYDNGIKFYTSGLINDGINLDSIDVGKYFLLLKYVDGDDIRYYSLKNSLNDGDIEYYTMTKNAQNNKVNISFGSKKIDNRIINLVTFDIKLAKLPENIYDITIDPGHGGIDSGAVFEYNGVLYKESFFTLNIALKLKDILEEKGYKVLLTREDDVNIDYYNDNGRATLPNKYGSKLCLSLHLNSDKSNMRYGGVEVYTPNDVDYSLARMLANNIASINGFSWKKHNLVFDGVYFEGFTEDSIKVANDENIKNGLSKYDISVGAPFMYMIREVGGRVTHAYVDGRNDLYGINPYYNSNHTAEAYLIELGYISYKDDLIKFINDGDLFSKKISDAIIDYYN